MIRKKQLMAGFVLCIIAATGILALAAFILLWGLFHVEWDRPLWAYDLIRGVLWDNRGNLIFGLMLAGIALSLIILAVYGKKGGRKEIFGIPVVSFLALFCFGITSLSLIGGILMLTAIPRKRPAVAAETPADGASKRAEAQKAPASSESEQVHAAGAALSGGKPVVKKQDGIFKRMHKTCRKLGAGMKKIRTRMCDEHASKIPAFLILTGLFAAAFIAYLATYFRLNFTYIFKEGLYVFKLDPEFMEPRLPISLGGLPSFFLTPWSFLWRFLTPEVLWHVSIRYSFAGDILPQLIFSLMPVYLVYLGIHNPLKLPKGYAALLVMLGALSFAQSDFMVICTSIECAKMYLEGWMDNPALGYLVYLLLASFICTQIATFFIFPYFLRENTKPMATVGIVLGPTLLLPFVIALVIAAVVVVLVIALVLLFICFILGLILWLLHIESDLGNPFVRGILGKPIETKEYTFTTDMGTSMTVYSQDGRNFYSASGSYVGHSEDGGKTIMRD